MCPGILRLILAVEGSLLVLVHVAERGRPVIHFMGGKASRHHTSFLAGLGRFGQADQHKGQKANGACSSPSHGATWTIPQVQDFLVSHSLV